jgi:putative DNA primase/helicase
VPIVTDRRILEEIAQRVINAPIATRPVIPERAPQGRGSGRARKTSGRQAGPNDPPAAETAGAAALPPQQNADPPNHPAAPPGAGPPDLDPPPWDAAPPAAAPSSAAVNPQPSQMGGSGETRGRDGRKGAGRDATARRNRGGQKPPDDAPAQAALDRRLAYFPLTDLGNAERFRERQRGRLIWVSAYGWLWWDGRRWARQGADGQVRMAVHRTVRSIQDEAQAVQGTDLEGLLRKWGRTSETHRALNNLGVQAAAYLEVPASRLDADPFCINVGNGTLFVRKPDARASRPLPARAAGVEPDGYVYFLGHDPDDLCTKVAPVDYVPGAPRERFDTFLAEVQPQAAMRRQLAAWRGYSMTGDVGEQKLCVFYGGGRNGKSVFEDICSFVAGDYAGTTPIETFLEEGRGRNAGQATPDLAELPGVRMLRTSEPNKGAKLNEGLIKLATGGEPIKARHLNRDYFDFYPQFKLTISGNHRPSIGGADEGIWRRIVLVPWSVTIPTEKQDPQLAMKLRAEASGILDWMLDGLADWLDNGLSLALETREATAEYRRDSDQLGRFLEACTERAEGEQVQSSVLHAVFNAWSTANSLNPWKGRGFSDAMVERGWKKTKSSLVFFLDLRLLKTVADFVDHEGKVKVAGNAGQQAEAFGSDDLTF